MIAQAMAIDHPTRVLSLTSIRSSTGDRSLPPARPEAAAVLLLPAPTDRAANVERAVHVFRTIGSPGFPFDEARVRELAARSYDRCFHPAGVARQAGRHPGLGKPQEGARWGQRADPGDPRPRRSARPGGGG